MLLVLWFIVELIGIFFSGGLVDKYCKYKVVMIMMCVLFVVLLFLFVFVFFMVSEGYDSCFERILCMNGLELNILKEINLIVNINVYNCLLMDIIVVLNCRNYLVLG